MQYKGKGIFHDIYASLSHSVLPNVDVDGIASTLEEVLTETTQIRDEVMSQLEKIDRDREENKKRLRLLEEELENDAVNKTELLQKKENILQFKWQLEEMNTEMKKVKLQTQKLQHIINTLNSVIDNKPVSQVD